MPTMYDFEVSLVGARPKVWRRFLLATSATFFDLHEAIQRACGWEDRHLFSFNVPSKVPSKVPSAPTVIAGIPDDDFDDNVIPEARFVHLDRYFTAVGTRATYEYDFGDDWVHTVTLHGTVEHAERRKRLLLDGARAFPPEDCGGMSGYRQCVAFVRAGRIPGKNDTDDNGLGNWLPKAWHPDHFDIDKTRKHFDSRVGKKPGQKAFTLSAPLAELPVADATSTSTSTNPWCAALGIPVPAIATVAATKRAYGEVKLADLAMVALLARGAPMTDAELLADLAGAGIVGTGGDLHKALKRSLAATEVPFLRDHLGRLIPDLTSEDMRFWVTVTALNPDKVAARAVPVPTVVADRLSREELDAAFDQHHRSGDTMARFVCAVLDVEGRPMTFDQILARYEAYGGETARMDRRAVLRLLGKRQDLVVDHDAGDVIQLAHDADLTRLRADVRQRARGGLQAKQAAEAYESWKVRHAVVVKQERRAVEQARRVVIAVSPSPEAPQAIEAWDSSTGRRFEFAQPDMAAFAEWISSFDVVVGVRPHLTLGVLGIELHRFQKIVDVLPTHKNTTVDGRKVPITWDAIVTGTLGMATSLAPLPTLMGLYRYALLHGELWLAVAGGAVSLPIDARLRGEHGAWVALREAKEAGTTVAMWVGVAPDLLPANVTPVHAVVRGTVVELLDDQARAVLVRDEAGRLRRVDLAQVNGLDVTGGTDFAWKLPVLWPPSSPE
jgi:hypothetical protein